MPHCIFHIKEEGGRNLCVAVFSTAGGVLQSQNTVLFPHPIFQGF